jgi:hypothetical protein
MQNRCKVALLFVLCLLMPNALPLSAQISNSKYDQEDKFRQLEQDLPTPNEYRTASGAPGHAYWQQQADYEIDVELDDQQQRIVGSERITYHNHSPDALKYLWLQLDANIFRPDSEANLTETTSRMNNMSFDAMQGVLAREVFDGGVQIRKVSDETDQPLHYTIVKTMMRVDLPTPLASGATTNFRVDWEYKINDTKIISGRTGFEYFPEDKNYLYEIAQWFPRMCAYNDVTGWQHKQYLGRGEFTLEFGNYVVRITVPNDHVVASTGTLLNPDEVLTDVQRQRLNSAKKTKQPVFVITPEEAKANESSQPTGKKTWIFKADRVRDFAFASSRKFIWDAMQHEVDGNRVMAMSFYPKEGEPLWSKYSTHAIIHTLNVYSRYTFAYPYPVAISVNGPVGGMEYPMICFNGPRPEKDGTYSDRTKYGLIMVVIHEVGHNYFPMIVNSDERRWTWMDEGLNTFLQYLSEQEWEDDYPSLRGEPRDIVPYMRSTGQVPIMTHSDSILQFGPNGYSKPATALNILRETVLGRELFDFAFKEYARRWKFKRPMPADFFRTMEDASGVDLDWFWRGWFYSTDHCDQAIAGVTLYNIDTRDPKKEKAIERKEQDEQPESLSKQRNKELPKRANLYPDLKDFYNSFDPLKVTPDDKKAYEKFVKDLDDDQRALLKNKSNFYVIDFENAGGLVMPIILEITFEDDSTQELRIPAEIWRRNNRNVSKLVITQKTIKALTLDPHLETADVDLSNNHFPPQIARSRFDLFKDSKSKNEMQKAGLGNKPETEKPEVESKEPEVESKEKQDSDQSKSKDDNAQMKPDSAGNEKQPEDKPRPQRKKKNNRKKQPAGETPGAEK